MIRYVTSVVPATTSATTIGRTTVTTGEIPNSRNPPPMIAPRRSGPVGTIAGRSRASVMAGTALRTPCA